MVSFKKIATGTAVVAASGTVVSGQGLVNSIANVMSNAIVSARHTNYPESLAKSDASKMAAFVTTDKRLSAYLEGAIQTAAHSSFNPSVASAYLTNIGSVLSSVTAKPEFYQLVHGAIRASQTYFISSIASVGMQEMGPYGIEAYNKVTSVASTDHGVSELVNSLTSEVLGIATKVLLNGGLFEENIVDFDNDFSQYIANIPEINEYWAQEEAKY